jgi:hypothetical protein
VLNRYAAFPMSRATQAPPPIPRARPTGRSQKLSGSR